MSIVETMARAVKADIGAQMGAKLIHPDPKVDDWTARSSGEINLEQVSRAALRAIKPEDFEPLAIGAYRNAYALVVAGETEDQRLARCLAAVMNAVGRGSI